jgi:hypothetical protein
MSTFAGRWLSTFGPMELTQEGNCVRGHYLGGGVECPIEGEVANGRLTFTYREPAAHGEGWFELNRTGKRFTGQWRPDGAAAWGDWQGERIGFDGLWETDFGLVRLVEEPDRVIGFYEVEGGATIDGRLDGNRLVFQYTEPKVRGEGRFELAEDGLRFDGEWRADGQASWAPWRGRRVLPAQGQSWLAVFEVPWQRYLADREYSFGHMLREFFARVPQVHVRHRFFTNEGGLHHCCRNLLYLAEPAVVLIATHAHPDGITVNGQTIDPRSIVESLRHASDIRLLHFSACLVMQDPDRVEALRRLGGEARLPISGYSTSVDWAASAIIEFAYLDLILARGLSPAAAAEQVRRLLPFAGDDEVPNGLYPPAGLRILLPETEKRTPPPQAETPGETAAQSPLIPAPGKRGTPLKGIFA